MSHVNLINSIAPVTKAPMSHVTPKMFPCHMSILINIHVLSLVYFLMTLGSMSHVNFKKQPCCSVEVKGQEL